MKSKILALAIALSVVAPLAASAAGANGSPRHSDFGTVYSNPPAEITAAGAQ